MLSQIDRRDGFFENGTYSKKIVVCIFLAFLYETLLLAATVVGGYRVELFPGSAIVGSSFIIALSYPILDVVSEVYGKRTAFTFVYAGILCGFIFAFLVPLVLTLPYPDSFKDYAAYKTTLGGIGGFTLGGTLGFAAMTTLNIVIILKLRAKTKGKWFAVRSALSTWAAMLLGTFISYFKFYLEGTLPELWYSVFMASLVKSFYVIFLAFFAQVLIVFLKFIFEDKFLFRPTSEEELAAGIPQQHQAECN